MKTNLLKAIAFAIVMTTCYNCSNEPLEQSTQESNIIEAQTNQTEALATCSGAEPQARIVNNGTVDFNLEIYSMDGTMLNFVHNIHPGDTSGWLTFSNGNTLFSVTNNSFQDEKLVFDMGTCTSIELEVGSNNLLLFTEPEQL